MTVLEMKYTAQDYIDAMDTLERATQYLAAQFNIKMTPAKVKANLESRNLLIHHRMAMLTVVHAILGDPGVAVG